MLNGVWHNPTKIIFGRDAESRVGDEIRHHAKRVLLHYGGETIKRIGLYPRILKSLEDASLKVYELGGVQPNPRAELVQRGISMCRKSRIDLILAVGGGSVIDSAKVIALGTPYEGDVYDFTQGVQPVDALKVATVLTIPGAGSESSAAAVINHEDRGQKLSYVNPLVYPVVSFLNPDLTTSVPSYLTSAGIVDAISHVFERYFSNTPRVDTTDRIGAALIQTLMKSGVRILKNPQDYDTRAEIMWACKLAHDDTAGFGRKHDWSCHGIAHEIAVIYDTTHGATLAVVFPAWMEFVAKKRPEQLLKFAHQVMGIENKGNPDREIHTAINSYRSFLKTMGMPTTLRDLGLQNSDRLAEVSEKSVQYMQSGTLGNFVWLSPTDILTILEAAY